MSKKVTAEQLEAAAWEAALKPSEILDEVPAGWLTLKQIAAKQGKAVSTMGAILARSVSEGRVERRDFRIRTGSVVRPTPHYRPL